VEKKDGGPI